MRASDRDAQEMMYDIQDSIMDIGIKRFIKIVVLLVLIGCGYYFFSQNHLGVVTENNTAYPRGTVVVYSKSLKPKKGDVILYRGSDDEKHVAKVTSAYKTGYRVKIGKARRFAHEDKVIGTATKTSSLIAPFANELITAFKMGA